MFQGHGVQEYTWIWDLALFSTREPVGEIYQGTSAMEDQREKHAVDTKQGSETEWNLESGRGRGSKTWSEKVMQRMRFAFVWFLPDSGVLRPEAAAVELDRLP